MPERTPTPPLRRAVLAVIVAALLTGAYVFSFLFAQATPKPHALPVGVAGAATRVADAERSIRRERGRPFAVRRFADEASARMALRDHEVTGVLVLRGRVPRLLTAPAAGLSAVTAIEERLPAAAGLPPDPVPAVRAVVPLPTGDPQGQALNLTVLSLMIFAVGLPLLLTLLAPALRVRERLVAAACFAVLSGTTGLLVADVALGALPGSYPALAAIASAIVFAVAGTVVALIGLIGPAGAGIGVVAFLIVGNVASGAAVTTELLPGAWRAVGPWLPPGAGAAALRSASAFGGAGLPRPLAVLVGYCAVACAVALAVGGRRPAPQGEPSGPTPDSQAPAAAGS